MQQRDQILDTLKTDFSLINSENSNYYSDIAEVKRGMFGFTGIVIYPTITFFWSKDKLNAHYFGNDQHRILTVNIRAYAETNKLGNNENAQYLADDIEYFIYHSFTYKDDCILGDVNIWEEGLESNISLVEMDFIINYHKDL